MAISPTPRRIVVVDGDDRFRDRLVRRLQRDGHQVCEAVDALGAVQLARTLNLDTAIIGDPADPVDDMGSGLRGVVGLAIRITDQQIERRDAYDIVLRRSFELDPLCLILLGDYVAAATALDDAKRVPGACGEQIRTGMRCMLEHGHAGLHRWTSPDAERSFLWG
jgi:hypothetical protein